MFANMRQYHSKGCEFCRTNGDSTWLYHNFKNENGKVICQKAVHYSIYTRISNSFSRNSETFVFYVFKQLK